MGNLQDELDAADRTIDRLHGELEDANTQLADANERVKELENVMKMIVGFYPQRAMMRPWIKKARALLAPSNPQAEVE